MKRIAFDADRGAVVVESGATVGETFRALAEIAQILRTVDLARVREVGRPHPADRLIDLADVSRDQQRELCLHR